MKKKYCYDLGHLSHWGDVLGALPDTWVLKTVESVGDGEKNALAARSYFSLCNLGSVVTGGGGVGGQANKQTSSSTRQSGTQVPWSIVP